MQGVSAHSKHEETQEDFYIHALLLLFFASQNRPMVATRYFCTSVPRGTLYACGAAVTLAHLCCHNKSHET